MSSVQAALTVAMAMSCQLCRRLRFPPGNGRPKLLEEPVALTLAVGPKGVGSGVISPCTGRRQECLHQSRAEAPRISCCLGGFIAVAAATLKDGVPTAAAAPTAAATAHMAQLQGVKLINVANGHARPFPPSGAVLTLIQHSHVCPGSCSQRFISSV